MERDIVELMAEGLHSFWLDQYCKAGFNSRLSLTGEEFMLPWDQLSEASKEFDRQGIRAALSAIIVPLEV